MIMAREARDEEDDPLLSLSKTTHDERFLFCE
jgi:hypothetical protein